MTNQSKSYIYASITIIFWSTVATAFKIALKEQSIFQVLITASFTSTVILFISVLLNKKLDLIIKSTKKDIINSALLGLLNPVLYYFVLFSAYDNLPAQVAQPLNLIWPIILVFISIPVLKQKIEKKSIIALFISFAGIIVVSCQGGGSSFHPEQIPYMLLSVSTALIWSIYWIVNVKDKRDESVKLFMGFLFASLYLLIISIFIQNPFPENYIHLINNIYIGFFEMGLAYIFWLKALKLSSSTDKVSNLIFIFPFLSLIFIRIILKEEIHMTTIYGLLLVICGLAVQKINLKGHRNVD